MLERHFKQPWQQLRHVLRMADITDVQYDGTNEHHATIVDIHVDVTTWYYRQAIPGRNYVVERGIMLPSGKFFTVLRSDLPVHVSENSPYNLVYTRFVRVGDTSFEKDLIHRDSQSKRYPPFDSPLLGYTGSKRKGLNDAFTDRFFRPNFHIRAYHRAIAEIDFIANDCACIDVCAVANKDFMTKRCTS